MRGLRVLLAAGVIAGASWFAPAAHALCHAFTVGASSSVREGEKVNVLVQRDGAVDDSSVRVRTVNGTAKAPDDFTALDQRVEFTGAQTSKTLTIQTREDSVHEPSEAFQIALSEGEGCNDTSPEGFSYGDPATVTILDDDPEPTAAPTAAPTPAPTPARTAAQTASPSPSPTPTESESPSPTPSETPTFTPVTVTEENGGGFPWLPVVAIGGFLAAAGGAVALMRMRSAGGA